MATQHKLIVRWSELGNPTVMGDNVIRSGRHQGITVEVGPGLINGRSKYSGDPNVEVEYSPAGQSGVWSAAKFTAPPDIE